MAFSDNLQFLRGREGITQEQLAERLDVSRQSVSKWESGISFPEMDTLLRLCDMYQVSLDVLLRGSAEETFVSDTAQYDAFMNSYIRRITYSVGGIIAGVAAMIALTALGVNELVSVSLFLMIVTAAVVTMVASGMQEDLFRKRNPVIRDFYTVEEKDAFQRKMIWLVAGGIGAILLGVVLMILIFTIVPEREPYESLATAGFLLMVAGAVMVLIYAGMQDEKYKIWKYNRDNSPTPEVKARKQLIGMICTAIMLLVAALYVGLGFARGAWGSAWWVFAVGGILCGAVSVVLDPYKGED